MRSRVSLRAAILDLVLVVAGTAMAFRPTLQSGFDRMQSDPGDTVFLNYVLEHETRVLGGGEHAGSLWSPPFFFPACDVLTYSENLLGTLPIYAALRGGLQPDTAYQVWGIVMLAFCYVSMAFALRRLSIAMPLASLGAFVFAYGLERTSHLGHGQLLPAAFTPLAILALAQHARTPARRFLAAALLASFLQVTAGVYLGWLLLFGGAAFALLLLVTDAGIRQRQLEFLRGRPVFVLSAILIWAGALLLFLRPYIVEARELPPRPWSDLLLLLPRPRSWISAPTGSLWAQLGDVFRPDTPLVWEHRLFPGAIPCLIVLIGLAVALRVGGEERARRSLVLAALGSVLVLGASSLRLPVKLLGVSLGGERVEYLTAWSFVYDLVPGATSIRAVGRIWTAMLPLALVGGLLALDIVLSSVRSTRLRGWATAVIVSVGVVEQYQAGLPSFDKREFRGDVRSTRDALAGSGCDAVYVHLDPSKPFYYSQLVGMWSGLQEGVAVINGYSGNFPPGYPDPTRSMTDAELRTWLSNAPPGRYCVVEPTGPGLPRRVRLLEDRGK